MTLRRALGSMPVALGAITLLAVWPMLRAGYPSIGDGLNHFYRLVEFDHLLRQGEWFPRWATDLGYGYGYPLFNFYPPLVYYLGASFHALGLSYANSLLAIYVLAFALAISGAYVLAHGQWGQTGGLIAACAYGLAPYLYFNTLARGALPETWGLGLLPWVLWAYVRLARRPGAASFLTATWLYTALSLSHLLSALLAAPLLILLMLISASRRVTFQASRFTLPAFILLPASFCLSLSLSAYFLLPAVLETKAVQISQLTVPGDLDFHNNFLTLGQLFAWPQTYDPRLVFVSLPPSLSLIALALEVIGLSLQLYRSLRLRTLRSAPVGSDSAKRPRAAGLRTLGVGISCLTFCLLTQPFTVRLWEALPIASLIQFPWRLVGPASLLLALLAASAAPVLENLKPGIFLLPSSFFLFSLAWTFAPSFSTPASPSVRDLTPYEIASGQLGTTSAGEFLPAAVHKLPAPDSLHEQYATEAIIDRLAALPEGVTLVSQSATLTSVSAILEASAPATLTFNLFYFPGWQATVDGQPAAIVVSDPHGLITVPVRAGRHTLVVRFGLTPLRTIASAISLITFVLSAAIALRFGIWNVGARSEISFNHPITGSPHHLVAIMALSLLILRATLIDGHDTLFRRSRFDGATVAGVGQPLDVNFGDQLVLIGLDQAQTTVAADGRLPLTLYWRAQNPPDTDYSTTVQVVDEAGNLFGQSDSQHPGRVPTSRWRLDQYARDEHRLTFLPGTPPGTYRLMAGVYQIGGAGLSVLDENRIPQGQAYPLGTLTITRAARPPDSVDAELPLQAPLGPLTLIGATTSTHAPLAGDALRLTLFWRAEGEARPDLQLRLELTTPDGAVIHSMVTSPARADYPTSAWASGEVVRAPLRFQIPASAPAGPAQLRASLIRPDGTPAAEPMVIVNLDMRVPARSFTVPAISHPRADRFGDVVKLLGYDLTPEGITLYWQALAPMDVSYTVFVHALAADDHILAQADTLPLTDARPTTGWLPGEILTDPYTLPLSGAAKIEVGLYNAQNAERLGTVTLTP